MFDIGFSELVVIAVVALIVIGPEKLPKTARTLGHLFGRLQRYVNDVKADINREIELDELRKLKQQVQTAAQEIETSVSSAARNIETGLAGVETQLNAAAETPAAAANPAPAPAAATPAAATPAAATPAAATPAAATPAAATPAAATPAEPPQQKTLPGFERG